MHDGDGGDVGGVNECTEREKVENMRLYIFIANRVKMMTSFLTLTGNGGALSFYGNQYDLSSTHDNHIKWIVCCLLMRNGLWISKLAILISLHRFLMVNHPRFGGTKLSDYRCTTY